MQSDSAVSDFSDADEDSSNELGSTVGPRKFAMDAVDSVSKRQATRVFKKSSPNGRITVYLGKRDFVDHITHVDPIGNMYTLVNLLIEVNRSIPRHLDSKK